jgi:hypothetical protein
VAGQLFPASRSRGGDPVRTHKRPHSKRRQSQAVNRVTPAEALDLARQYDATGCTIKELAAESGRSFVAVANAVLHSQRHKNRLYGG